MPALFKKLSTQLGEHRTTLAEISQIPFNHTVPDHTKLVDECTQVVKEKLRALQLVDKKMTIGFSLGVAALSLSWLFPVLGIVATAGIAYGAYQLGKRQQAYLEYETALENLSQCCVWCLGKVPPAEAKTHEIVTNASVQEMIKTLAPITSAQQLNEFVDVTVKAEVGAAADHTRKEQTVFDHHLDKEKADLYFNIYGYKQGGFLAILKGIGYAIKSTFTSVAESFSSKESSSKVESSEPGKATPV